jgi:TatD DNase family protein
MTELQLVDSHCHLDFPELANRLPEVLANAASAGVKQLVSIGTDPSDWPKLQQLAAEHPQICYSVGVHPDEVAKLAADGGLLNADQLISWGDDPKMVAFGETGLDYYREQESKQLQVQSFVAHLAAAATLDVPVIVHSRDAEADTIAQLQAAKRQFPQLKGVIHCFTGTAWLAEQALALDFMISIAGIVTFKNAEELRAVIRDVVPLNRLLLETDAPFLAPVPKRGKSNEPAFVRHTAEAIALLKQTSLIEVAQTTTANFHRLFSRCAG